MTGRTAIYVGLAVLVVVGTVLFLYLSTRPNLANVIGGPG